MDVSTSIVDKKIALEYYNTMAGDGDLELDSEHLYSQNPEKIAREIDSVNNGKKSGMNLIETTKMTYAGDTPLVGGKLLNSKAFYGGIGAQVQEMFSVYEMEKDETSFFASTTPYNPGETCDSSICKDCCCLDANNKQIPNCKCEFNKTSKICEPINKTTCLKIPGAKCKDRNGEECKCEGERNRHQHDDLCGCDGKPNCDCDRDRKDKEHKNIKPEDLIGKLEKAGRDGDKVEELMTAENGYYVPSHVIGIDTKTSFNGTWGTDATWHKIFYKDIKAHEMFTGTFEAEKLIKFHENPVPEKEKKPCQGVDC